MKSTLALILHPIAIGICACLTQCARNEQGSATSATDSAVVSPVENVISESTAASEPAGDGIQEEQILPDLRNLVVYNTPEEDSIWSVLTAYPPFQAIQRLAWAAIQAKDSLAEDGFSPADSTIFPPQELKAYRAILDYKRAMNSPTRLASFPGLFALTRNAEVTDSGSNFLPQPGPSVFLIRRNPFSSEEHHS